MKVTYLAAMVFLGVVLAVHLAMNGKVGAVINNPRVANAVFWCIGAAMACIVGFTGWKSGALTPMADVSPWLLTAGAIGACLVFAIGWLIPEVGAGNVMITLLVGQILGGVILSHFGWLGSPVDPINMTKILGIGLMIAGTVLATMVNTGGGG